MNSRQRNGFTLIEMVVAIAISSVVIVFASMFITAPVDAYEAQSRRARLLGDAATAWPRIENDLRRALPNSVRETRNGVFVLLEMLDTSGFARYLAPPAGNFTVVGTSRGYFDTVQPGTGIARVRLSVNNQGPEAYTQTISMTPLLDILTATPTAVAGEANLTLSANPLINGNSPRDRVYLVRGFVAYLCNENQGTLTRYWGEVVVANANAHSTPAGFGGAQSEVVARGLTACMFTERRPFNRPQEVTVALTTTRGNESVTMRHRATLENLP